MNIEEHVREALGPGGEQLVAPVALLLSQIAATLPRGYGIVLEARHRSTESIWSGDQPVEASFTISREYGGQMQVRADFRILANGEAAPMAVSIS